MFDFTNNILWNRIRLIYLFYISCGDTISSSNDLYDFKRC